MLYCIVYIKRNQKKSLVELHFNSIEPCFIKNTVVDGNKQNFWAKARVLPIVQKHCI